MTRESIPSKAQRIVDADGVAEIPGRIFEVQGDHGSYHVVVTADGAYCSCPARRLCAHVASAALLITRQKIEPPDEYRDWLKTLPAQTAELERQLKAVEL